MGYRSGTAPSQDVCFDEAREMVDWWPRAIHQTSEPGEIVDGSGRVPRVHGGIGGFTAGQRRGLNRWGPALYVIPRPEERQWWWGRETASTRTLHLRECIWRQRARSRAR